MRHHCVSARTSKGHWLLGYFWGYVGAPDGDHFRDQSVALELAPNPGSHYKQSVIYQYIIVLYYKNTLAGLPSRIQMCRLMCVR
jgi:hypothetical protein